MTKEVGRAEYGIDRRTFIIVWETSNNADEAVKKLAEVSRKAGLSPMPKPLVLARASGYRKVGVNLKKYTPGRKPGSDADADNKLVGRIRAGKANPLTDPESGLVERVIAEVMRRLGGVRNG